MIEAGMLDTKIMIAAYVIVVLYLILRVSRRQRFKEYHAELHKILNKEEYKVKGRFD